jgi:hypothetical protein
MSGSYNQVDHNVGPETIILVTVCSGTIINTVVIEKEKNIYNVELLSNRSYL